MPYCLTVLVHRSKGAHKSFWLISLWPFVNFVCDLMCVSVGHPATMVANILLETSSSLKPFPKTVFVMVKRRILLSELTILTCPFPHMKPPEEIFWPTRWQGFFLFLFRVKELNMFTVCYKDNMNTLYFYCHFSQSLFWLWLQGKKHIIYRSISNNN